MQGLSIQRLIQNAATQWNNTYYILERLIELKVAIAAAGAEFYCEVLVGRKLD